MGVTEKKTYIEKKYDTQKVVDGVTEKIKREKEDDTKGETEENSQREEKG